MSVRWIAARYAWIIVLREAMHSSRWGREEKLGAVVLLGLAMSIPTLVSFALWILTGRRILQFWFRPWVAFVDPFAPTSSRVFRNALGADGRATGDVAGD